MVSRGGGVRTPLPLAHVLDKAAGRVTSHLTVAEAARDYARQMKITRLLLVRHGATQLTSEDRFSGAVGVELSDEGRDQARRLAARLASESISAVYCSPLSRTLETASIISAPHRLTPLARDGLREISHGRWEGLTRQEVETRFPEEYLNWESDPFTFAPVDGETGLAVLARALPVIRDLVVCHPGQKVLVVSHKATLRLLLSSLLGFDARGYRDRLDQSPACLNVLDFRDPARARLMLFNDVSHYQDEPRRPEGNLSKWWDSEVIKPPAE
jgi:broad specificity phosphatase PhoE